MGRVELKINLNGLQDLEGRFKSPALEARLKTIPELKEVSALVAQAIADNFDKEGPGWKPLKGATIRNSVALNKETRAMLKDAKLNAASKMGAARVTNGGKRSIDWKRIKGQKAKFFQLVDKEIEKIEAAARTAAHGSSDPRGAEALGNRQILRRTGLLFDTVTTPNPNSTIEKKDGVKVMSGQNIRRVEGTNLVWGTNLVYAETHQKGRDKIPARPFLVLRDEWRDRLTKLVFQLMTDMVNENLAGKK